MMGGDYNPDGDDPLEDDDMLDGAAVLDDDRPEGEAAELGVDPHVVDDAPAEREAPPEREASPRTRGTTGVGIKIKPMPVSMRKRWPNIRTMLLTRHNGTQLLFVRGTRR